MSMFVGSPIVCRRVFLMHRLPFERLTKLVFLAAEVPTVYYVLEKLRLVSASMSIFRARKWSGRYF